MARGVSASEMTNKFAEARVTYRGTTYVLRELPMDRYDELVEMATAEQTVDGETTKVFDQNAHTRLLTVESLIEPKMTAKQLYGEGTRLVRALQVQVGKLHWDPEPVEDDKDKDDDEGEASAPANP